MSNQYRTNFSNRDFVALVRAELAAAGRTDVTIERSWIDEDEPGYPFLLHVPVGTELTLPLTASSGLLEARSHDDLLSEARVFAKALVNLKSARPVLEKYARDVRKAANAAVAGAQANGLDVLVEKIGFKPTRAWALTDASWKDAVAYVLAAVTVRHTSFYLRPDTSSVWVGEPAEVAESLQSLLEDQRERQDRLAEMDALGADLIVDQITLDLLAAHGLDAEEVLERAWKDQCVNLTVVHEGREASLSLITSLGKVKASMQLEDAFWNGEFLWLAGDEHRKDHKHLIGKSLGDLVRHPVFASRPIVDAFHRHADHFVFDLSDKVMFDADTRRVWRDERLAA